MKIPTELIAAANPWWASSSRFAGNLALRRHREPLIDLFNILESEQGPAASLIFGPRSVGKSTMLMQTAAQLLTNGTASADILYLPAGIPAIGEVGIEACIAEFWNTNAKLDRRRLLLIDDIDGISDWREMQARIFAKYAPVTIIATSALAPLIPDAEETEKTEANLLNVHEIPVPPLSFAEFLRLTGRESSLVGHFSLTTDLRALNAAFFEYLNHGGFPGLGAAGGGPHGAAAAAQFVLDIVDDGTPNHAGIHDTRDLRRAFAYLVGRTGEELAYEAIAKDLGIAKNTLRKYMDYLERAGLLYRLNRVDLYGKRMERATRFKVYPASPCFFGALHENISPEHPAAGRLIEAALASHIARGALAESFSYANWTQSGLAGDIPLLAMEGQPPRAGDPRCVAWSPGGGSVAGGLGSLLKFCKSNRLDSALMFDSASFTEEIFGGVTVTTRPASWACYLTSYYFDPVGAKQPGPYGLKAIF